MSHLSRTRAAVIFTFLAIVRPCVFAQSQSLEINQYAHTSWTVRDGFFDGAVQTIAQTPDGYLWIGTAFGLYRFDGLRKVPWRPPPGERLQSSDITKLLVTRDGRLWIGTATELVSWKDGSLAHYPGLNGQTILSIAEDHDGTVWVGEVGSPGRLCSIQGSAVQCFGQDNSLGRGVLSVFEEGGRLWVGAQTGLWRWKPGPPKRYPMAVQELFDFSKVDGEPLLIAMHTVSRFDGEKVEPYPVPAAREPLNAFRLLRDRHGNLWIGTIEGGLVHVHEGRIDRFTRSDGLSGDLIYAILEDREGSVWVATSEGLDRFRDLAISTIATRQGLSSGNVMAVAAGRDGSVWLGTFTGLNRWKNGQVTVFDSHHGLREGGAGSLFEDSRGRIWVSTLGGIGYIENDRFVPVPAVSSRIAHNIAAETDGSIWINDQQALIHLIGDRVAELIPWKSLGRKDFAMALVPDPPRRGLWLGFGGGGVSFFKDGTIRQSYSPAEGLGAGQVSDLHLDSDGSLWASTVGGLSRIKDTRVATLTSRNGLPCDAVHWMMEDDSHAVWIYMPCGLVRTARSELEAWIADPAHVLKIAVFDSSDGVRVQPAGGSGYSPHAAKSVDGRMWFATHSGASAFDPRHVLDTVAPPPVQIEQIAANHKVYWENLVGDPKAPIPPLPPQSRDLEIDYTALSLVAPEKIHFRYKLEGYDRDWQDAGNRRQAFYTNLAPQNYRFRVTAYNNGGEWKDAGASFDFSISPAYYQTGWFRAIIATSILVLLSGLYRLRLYQVAREFNMRLEERVSERTRIARDLHDTLLQSFQGLMLRLQVVKDLMPEGKVKDQLEDTLQRGDHAIEEGRSAVYELRSSATRTNELAHTLKTLGDELATQDSAAFRLVVEGPARDLQPIIRDEVYRVTREALRNAFKHARAQHIETEISYGPRELRVRVRDDGEGIAPQLLEKGRSGHYGLPGMRERAQQAGGKLDIWSGAGTGTEIELTIPGAIAYGSSARRPLFRLFRKKAG